ncbi:nonsense-mediated mRNA decay factor SMG7-like [Macrosteles quadrilineatus]|uniref:nonsense-mediated mRNA decay factor SMG7-like n=1 Tax=Macrosteles quadrilineatus TaxID=74068 RepID=UPI0023E12C10|nr:nonsense-mediated mRNA decay factor SMG7-like [Macrosteles quadrilineatus]
MGLQAAVQALKKADRLKEKVINCEDILNDNEAWLCQQQLQEIYQQVLILDLEYALDKKVEQDLWSHGFKKYIATLQALAKDKKNQKRRESQALLTSCLDTASGFYLALLQELCTTFDLDLPFRRKDVTPGVCRRPGAKPQSQPHRNSCYYICQHCLVHLGDIARYRNNSRQAEVFYRHAVQLSPTSGQPYNQLALLEASRGDRLSTVFHYMRSIAVRHMFPAASSNLALTLEKCATHQWNKDTVATKLTTVEYLSLYLKLHAFFHSCRELEVCGSYVKTLTDTLTPHIATQSFNSWKLVQMFTINVFAYYHPCRDGETAGELTQDEVKMRSYVVDLIAGSLNAYLLPVYTLKQDETLLDYFALPVIKLTLEWVRLQPHVLTEEGFSKRLQIWPSLSRLLNVLHSSLTGFSAESYDKVPLPEDSDLQGFMPLEKAFADLNFSLKEGSAVSSKLRAARLLQLGEWLTQNTPNLIQAKMNDGKVVYEAVCGVTVLPSSELIRELEELSLNKVSSPSPAPSETASSRTSNTTPDLQLHNPSLDILSALDTVQEKRAGILKPQAIISDEGGNVSKSRSRQNVAMQAILRRSQEQEIKQVTFKTPSPPPQVMPAAMPRHSLPPPPSFPYPPPPLAPPSRPPWPDDPRTPSWWSAPENTLPPPPRTLSFSGLTQPAMQQPPSNDIFNNSLNFKNPFPTMFSQPPPFSPPHTEPAKTQVEPPQPNNMMTPTYSLFSPTWTAPQHPPPPVVGILGQQSLWYGPGPSPLERLLEQQKQLREGPGPHHDNT